MKTTVVYYTFGGSSEPEAKRIAAERGADICRVSEAKNRCLLASFIPGGLNAMKRKASAIQPLGVDLNAYGKIVLVAPIWAGFPAPAFNAAVSLLPPGKEIELYFCSGSGSSEKSRQGTVQMIEKKSCTVVSYNDIKTNAPPKKAK